MDKQKQDVTTSPVLLPAGKSEQPLDRKGYTRTFSDPILDIFGYNYHTQSSALSLEKNIFIRNG